jgi:hypothetical protein
LERFGRIALKTILWVVGSIVFLVLLILVLIQVPAVQNFAKNKAVSFLQGKIKTKVQINRLSIEFPKLIVLEGVYFADQKGDTLLAGDKLKVNITMLQLLHKKVEINEIDLEGITGKVTRIAPDTNFNYSYIMKAFAGEQKKTPQPTDTTSTLKFALDKINFDRINLVYRDDQTGNNIKFLLGHFDTRVKTFDMDKMIFTIPKITMSGVDAVVIQKPKSPAAPAPVDTAVKPVNLNLTLGTIDLSKINVDYESNEMGTKVNMGKLLVEMDRIDFKNHNVAIKDIQLIDTKASVALAKPQTVKKAITKVLKKADTLVAATQAGTGWALKLGKFNFKNDNVKFDNNATAPVSKGIDYAHMDIKDLNTDGQDLAYSSAQTSGSITSFSFRDKSGLNVKKFHTNFLYGEKQSYLKDLYLETPQTVIKDYIQVAYPSIDAISTHLGELRVNANLAGSQLGLKDVLILMPSMASMEPFKSSPNAVFKIDSRVEGQVNNLRIPRIDIAGLSNTRIKGAAILKGLPDMNKAYFDVRLDDFNTSRADIARLAPKGSIPASISIPSAINVKGTFRGGMKNFNTNLNLHSSYGNMVAVASLQNATSKTGMVYNANIKADNLDAGKFIKMEQTVGKLNLTFKVKGSGTDLKTAVAQFSGNIASAYVKGYNYRNLVLTGTANHGAITTVARMKDPNISFALNAKANMSKKYPAVNMTLNVDSVNLQKLKLYSDDLRFHGKIVANVPTASLDYLNGNVQATDLLLNYKGQRYKLDTISVISTATADSSTLKFRSEVLSARLAGQYKLLEIGTAIQATINKYFNMASTTAPAPKYSPENFRFTAVVTKSPLLTQFVPGLKQLDPVKLNGSFNSQSGQLLVNGNMPKVVYGTNTINNIVLNVNTGNSALNYSIAADEVKVSSYDLLNTTISGNAQNNKLNTSIQVRDAAKKERYRIAGVFSVLNNEYQFSFIPTGLILDYTQWAVNADNYFQFGGKGILAHNFTITNANQILSVNSNPQQFNGPLSIDFTNFKIETLTKMAQQNSLLVGGTINGNAVVKNLDKSATFNANMNITDFSFKGDTVGNIAVKVNDQTANTIAANVAITGKGNQVNLDGYYYTNNSNMDLNLNIATLNLKSIEGFTMGYIKQASGSINGQLKITGTTSAPIVRGDVNFNQAAFNIAMLNSYYRMPNEKITFNQDGVLFNDFNLVDSAGNKATVTGTLYTQDFSTYRFGIDITSNNFRVMNSTAKDNKLYYGQLFLDSKIKIRGDMNKPVVDATLKINDKTNLTMVLPQSDPGVEDRKGVVEFVDKAHPKVDSILKSRLDSLKKSDITGLDVSANITIDKNAAFTIVVDERNGDIVHIKGDAQLNGTVDPSGKTSLTGTYTVNEGSYDLSYSGLSRKFALKQGSTITWNGDPTSAILNLTAVYVAITAPIDLVDNQLTTETEKTMYKQRLPFNVDLTLRNQLMQPDISFDINLPPNGNYRVTTDVINTVNTKLDQLRQDPNELNKQVFAVLLLNHFISQNSFQSQAGGSGLQGTIRNSVSSLLSDQLNKLAGNLIAGVDLNFNLNSGADYSSGTQQNRTDLNVGLSKRFLNDRLTVTVGNNFNLEGAQANEQATNIAGDISVGYKLTSDGRYLLRAYRKDQYVVIQGQVIETGVGFTLTVDYNRFSQVFKGLSPQAKQLKKEQKAEDKQKKKEEKQNKDQAVEPKQAAIEPEKTPN